VVPPPRHSHGCVAVAGKMVIIGGHTTDGEQFTRKKDIWVYDPKNNTFEEIIPLGEQLPAISRHRLVSVNNIVYSFGGILQDKQKLNAIFTFDLHTKCWQALAVKGTPPSVRCDPVVVSHGTDIIVFGGSDVDMNFPSDMHVFNTATCTWWQPEVKGTPPSSRIGSVGTVIRNKLYIYGGGKYNKVMKNYTEIYLEVWAMDLTTWTWELEATRTDIVPKAGDFLNAFSVGNHFFIEGGWFSKPWCFDTVTRTWCMIPCLNSINNNDSTCVVLGESVYYYGGYFNVHRHHFTKVNLSALAFLGAPFSNDQKAEIAVAP